MLKSTFSLLSPLPILCPELHMGKQERRISCSLLTLFPHSSVSPSHGLQCFKNCSNMGSLCAIVPVRTACFGVVSSTGCRCGPLLGCRGGSLRWCLEYLYPFSFSSLIIPRLFLTPFFSFLTLFCSILLFLKHVFTEAPPPLLMGSAMSCGGPTAEPAGLSCVWHLLPETGLQPSLQHLPIDTWHTAMTKNSSKKVS